MLFGKAKRPRRFQFQPRYYHEEEDKEKRIHFRRIRGYDPHNRRQTTVLIFLIILVGLMLYFFGPIVFPFLSGHKNVTIGVTNAPK
jgi:hypothetical protein